MADAEDPVFRNIEHQRSAVGGWWWRRRAVLEASGGNDAAVSSPAHFRFRGAAAAGGVATRDV